MEALQMPLQRLPRLFPGYSAKDTDRTLQPSDHLTFKRRIVHSRQQIQKNVQKGGTAKPKVKSRDIWVKNRNTIFLFDYENWGVKRNLLEYFTYKLIEETRDNGFYGKTKGFVVFNIFNIRHNEDEVRGIKKTAKVMLELGWKVVIVDTGNRNEADKKILEKLEAWKTKKLNSGGHIHLISADKDYLKKLKEAKDEGYRVTITTKPKGATVGHEAAATKVYTITAFLQEEETEENSKTTPTV